MGKSHSKDETSSVQKMLKISGKEADTMLKQFFQLTQNRRSLTREQFYETIKQSLQGKEFDAEHWSAVFDMLDLNGDGTIDFYEFSISMVYSSKLSLDKKIDYLFRMMDFDKDGTVSVEEMRRAIRTASKIANDAETVWNLEEYFPTLVGKDSLTKKEFRDAMKGPKGKEIMNLLTTDH